MHLTFRGTLMLLLAAPIMAMGTWLPGLQWLAIGLIVLVIALFVLDWRGAGHISTFQVKRTHDTKLSLGADNPISLSVRSLQRRKIIFRLRDEPPDDFQIDTSVLNGEVSPRDTWQGVYYVRPLRRGDYGFGNLNLRWQGPFGLVIRQASIEAQSPVKVYPNLLDVQRYDLLLRRNRLQELGLRNTRLFGEGTEFERLRDYVPDDEFRRIDWKATARRHHPVTIEYQTERSQTVITVIDVGRMMQSPVKQIAKLDYVINAVLLLGYVATGMGDKMGMMTFADDIGQYINPRQGRKQFYQILEMLYAVKPQPVEPNYRRALSYLALKQRKRSLIVVFTDLSGGITIDSLVAHISVLAQRNLPLVVTISDPDIYAAARQSPTDSLSVYQRAAANQFLDERQLALDTLQCHGVLTLDVPAHQLSWKVINRYLELKGRNLL